MTEAEEVEEDILVVVELPPEARLVAGDELRFVGLGTSHPRLKLPSGAELVGRYEESVGDLLVMQPTSDKVRARPLTDLLRARECVAYGFTRMTESSSPRTRRVEPDPRMSDPFRFFPALIQKAGTRRHGILFSPNQFPDVPASKTRLSSWQDVAAGGSNGAKLMGKTETKLRFHRPDARHAAAR